MAVKLFIRGDFRTLIIDNDYPTNYKVYYNGRWNYIQDEESFVNRLNPSLGESYLNRFNLKVLDHNQWVKLAILDNYYNKNEKRNSIFYRTITRENFNFKARAVNFTEVDARLGLNNLQTPFSSNEIKYNKEEIEEITDKIQKDEILYKLGNLRIFDELLKYDIKNEEKFNLENYLSLEDSIKCKEKFFSKSVKNISYNEEKFKKDDSINIVNDAFLQLLFKKQFNLVYNKENVDNYNFTNIDLKYDNYNSCVLKMKYFVDRTIKINFNIDNCEKNDAISINDNNCFISFKEV